MYHKTVTNREAFSKSRREKRVGSSSHKSQYSFVLVFSPLVVLFHWDLWSSYQAPLLLLIFQFHFFSLSLSLYYYYYFLNVNFVISFLCFIWFQRSVMVPTQNQENFYSKTFIERFTHLPDFIFIYFTNSYLINISTLLKTPFCHRIGYQSLPKFKGIVDALMVSL